MNINKVYIPILTDRNRYILLYGSAGSGKSVFAACKILLRLTTEANHRFLVIRKVKSTVRSSTYQLFLDLINQYNLESEFNVNKSEFRITHNDSGNEIIFSGLDDSEKLKSLQGITGIWIEEATELESSDFSQLDLRLRGDTANYKQIILSFNPTDESHWIKKSFFENKSSDTTILKTTYKDNAFIDEEYIRVLQERISHDENLYRIYVKGDWGRENTGGNFYKSFLQSKTVKFCEYNSELPLHISWDFNVSPSCSLVIAQLINKKLSIINEISLEHPRNGTADICTEFKKQYFTHKAGVFIYGDASGLNNDSKYEKGFNHYSIVQNELKIFNPVMRVGSKNPSLYMRGLFINRVFNSIYDGIELVIHDKCSKLIEDLSYVKENSEGGKFKQMKKDKNGQSYQMYGHFSDCLDYLLCTLFDSEFQAFQVGGKKMTVLFGDNPFNSKTRY